MYLVVLLVIIFFLKDIWLNSEVRGEACAFLGKIGIMVSLSKYSTVFSTETFLNYFLVEDDELQDIG
jgi:hypothetical protein